MKKTLFLLAFMVGISPSVFAQAVTLSTTTLSTAVNGPTSGYSGATFTPQNQIPLASLSGILGPSQFGQTQTILWIDREAMEVTAVNTFSGTVTVKRTGWQGSIVSSHLSGSTVYIAAPSQLYTNDPVGSCTVASTAVTPWINVVSGNRWTCVNSVWTISFSPNAPIAVAPTTAAPNVQHVTLAKACPSTTNCYVVADDVQLVSDATWSATANVQVTLSGTDPQFQCPGGVYPCNASTPGCNATVSNVPNTSCDVNKTAFGTTQCVAVNPDQCLGSIPQGTISSIASATVATLTSTASSASNAGTGNHLFSWGTIDTTQISAASDFCYTLKTMCQVDLPCGRMMYDSSSMSPIRVTRYMAHPVSFQGNHCAELIVVPTFNCTASGSTDGCFIDLHDATGQVPTGADGWSDYAEGISFFGLGQDLPTAGQFTGTTYNLAYTGIYARSKDIWIMGTFWNFPIAKHVYGHFCDRSDSCDNDVAWSSGNYGLLVGGAIAASTTVHSGFYGNDAFHSCDLTGSNSIVFVGVNCSFSLTSTNSENQAGLDALSTFTGEFSDQGSNYQSTMWFNSGTAHFYGTYQFPSSGAISGLYVQNAAANVYLHGFHYAVGVGNPWLHLSAGTLHFGCGNSGIYTGGSAPVITGGTLQVDGCSVGSDNQAAQTAAIGAKTLFTVGPGTVLFRVHVSVQCTTTSAAATVTPAVLYTDTSNTAQTVTGTAANCAALGAASNTSQDVTFRAKNATAIQYQTTIANTPTYDVSTTVEQLSLN